MPSAKSVTGRGSLPSRGFTQTWALSPLLRTKLSAPSPRQATWPQPAFSNVTWRAAPVFTSATQSSLRDSSFSRSRAVLT